MNHALQQNPDQVSRIALFGARFVDAATGRAIDDGLTVTVCRASRPDQRRDAFRTRSGVYALQRVPGLDRLQPAEAPLPFDLRNGDRDFWTGAVAAAAPYVIEVRDRLARFLPVSYATTLPTPGPFGTDADPTGLPAPRMLFSAPARTAPPAVGVVRGELHTPATATKKEGALANALVIVDIGASGKHRGIADASGRFAVMFPLPEPVAATGASIKPFVWPVRISIHHQAPPPGAATTGKALPDLDALLAQESASAVPTLADLVAGSTPVARIDTLVHFGRERVLKTTGSSFLYVSPA